MSAFVSLDHVQLAIPVGGEADARRFYCDLLGMEEIPKPPALAARGGLWLRSGGVVIHLGVEADFRAARKAHPALVCASYGALLAKLRAAGLEIRDDHELPGVERCHIDDVFGNRIELIADRERVDRVDGDPAVTDEQRDEWNVPPLAEAKAQAERMNAPK